MITKKFRLTVDIKAIVDFIKNNETFHEKCITADLCFKINLEGFDKELKKFLKPGTHPPVIASFRGDLSAGKKSQ